MPIPTGKDHNFYRKLTISNVNFQTDPDIKINIMGVSGFSLMNYDTTNPIEYSFNGIVLHGDLTPNTGSSSIIWDNRRVSSIWFRSPSGQPCIVRFECWAGVAHGQ